MKEIIILNGNTDCFIKTIFVGENYTTQKITVFNLVYKLESANEYICVKSGAIGNNQVLTMKFDERKTRCFSFTSEDGSEDITSEKLKGVFALVYMVEDEPDTLYMVNFCNIKGKKSYSSTYIESSDRMFIDCMLKAYSRLFTEKKEVSICAE